MTHTLKQNRTLDSKSDTGNIIVPFEMAQVDRFTRICQHLYDTASLDVLMIARDYLGHSRLSEPVRMVPTTSNPRREPIRPQH